MYVALMVILIGDGYGIGGGRGHFGNRIGSGGGNRWRSYVQSCD